MAVGDWMAGTLEARHLQERQEEGWMADSLVPGSLHEIDMGHHPEKRALSNTLL